MEEAKDRWLKMLFTRLYENLGEDKLAISDDLLKYQIKNMEDLIDKSQELLNNKNLNNLERKKEIGKEETILKRYYINDSNFLSLNQVNFKKIWEYLIGNSNDELTKFANKKINSKQGKLFYFNRVQAERQFIADLLKTSLYIERMRRDNNE